MKRRMLLSRAFGNSKQTLGQIHVLEGENSIFGCCSLELPDLGNEVRISRIPEGDYTVVKRYSSKYGFHFHITDVEGRSYILMHLGNFHSDILGCILPGLSFKEINNDGFMDVVSSGSAMKKLLELMPDEFMLSIK